MRCVTYVNRPGRHNPARSPLCTHSGRGCPEWFCYKRHTRPKASQAAYVITITDTLDRKQVNLNIMPSYLNAIPSDGHANLSHDAHRS
jgi:hypothetical protein